MRESEVTHRKAVGRPAIRAAHQSAHLVETKSDVAAAADEAQAMNIRPAKDAPAVRGAADATEKSDLLVVPNRGDGATRSLGGLANTHA